jgi:hypothetical protein
MSAALSQRTVTLFPHRFAAWKNRGLSSRAASAASVAGCDTAAEIALLGREHFEKMPNCSSKTLQELAVVGNWPPKRQSPVDAIAASLALAIADPAEAREAATDAVIALRRSGYMLSARRTERHA